MGLVRAFSGAIAGTIGDQWKEIITAGKFDEHVVVAPGIKKTSSIWGGENIGDSGVITKGSKIYVPENTAAFIFNQSGIQDIITEPGGYEFTDGQDTIFDGSTFAKAIMDQAMERLAYGGISPDSMQIAFVNLREIRDIKFGTRGPQVYNDIYYGADLEIYAYGSFTIQVTDPVVLIENFVPPNVFKYTFDDPKARSQILSEFLQSFTVALNSLSSTYRISQLSSQANNIAKIIVNDSENAGTWEERFGFKIVKVSIENIEFTEDSRELVKQFSANKMNVRAYEEVSQKASNIAAQQKIAQGIQNNGLGDGAGMMFGMSMVQGMGMQAQQNEAKKQEMSFDEQIDALKKLKELVDAGVITQQEFEIKKKDIMGL